MIVAALALFMGAAGLWHVQFARRPLRHALAGSTASLILGFIALGAALARHP